MFGVKFSREIKDQSETLKRPWLSVSSQEEQR